MLIGREGYRITGWNLTEEACCGGCKAPAAGLFEGAPGDWGARFRPVRLADWEEPAATQGA